MRFQLGLQCAFRRIVLVLYTDLRVKILIISAQPILQTRDSCTRLRTIHCTRVSEKNSQNCFCHNFVKFLPTLIIFYTRMAKTIELRKMHSFITSTNLCQRITV